MPKTAIIMAGGAGERFWPLSRKRRPKQLLKLTNPDTSMLQEAIDRIAPVIPPDRVFIITSEILQHVIRDEIKGVPAANVVAEPSKRNTAGCIALGAAFIAEKLGISDDNSDDPLTIAVLTADHAIGDAELFCQTIDAALQHAADSEDLVTLGIRPTRAATGYGYIEYDTDAEVKGEFPALPVTSFHEKPDETRARAYVDAGNFLWNSGMFFWRYDVLRQEMMRCLPEVGGKIDSLREGLRGRSNDAVEGAHDAIRAVFDAFPDISIDYGLMEKAAHVAVIPARFAWDDVGSLDALERAHPADQDGNVVQGDVVLLDMHNSLVVNASTDGRPMAVAAMGMDDVVLITTDDGILLCPRERLQDVKKIVKEMRSRFGEKFV